MKIKEVSEKFNMPIDTLRFYEKKGLFGEVPRNKSGIREYTPENLERIEFIKYMRTTGIPIETLAEFIRLTDEGDETLDERRKMLLEQKKHIKDKITELEECLRRVDVKLEIYGNINEEHDTASKEVIKRCRKYEEAKNGNN